MTDYSSSPKEIFLSLSRNWNLVVTMVIREIAARYRGAVIGILWSLVNPIFMLAVYTFVFSVIFKARWNVNNDSKTEFALVLFAGLIIFNLFSECISRAPNLIISNVNYVKKVVFPLEILPWVAVGSAMFHALVSLGVWCIAYMIIYGIPHATILFFPLVLMPLVLMIMGLSWILASLGVFWRDISQLVGMVIMVLMFLSPIFYPAEALPESYRRFFIINPLYPAIKQGRDVLIWGKTLDLTVFSMYMLGSIFVAWLGFAWFQKTRKGFSDVL